MTRESEALWAKARQSLATAELLLESDPAASVSRSYYAAFYAVSCLFANQGASFTKHKALEVAVHRDLVRAGLASEELGAAYSRLFLLRQTADYEALALIQHDDARECIAKAKLVIDDIGRLTGTQGPTRPIDRAC